MSSSSSSSLSSFPMKMILVLSMVMASVTAFVRQNPPGSLHAASPSSGGTTSAAKTMPSAVTMGAAPHRYSDNIDGPLYVNDRCINCAACAMFAPSTFQRSSTADHHKVYQQPETPDEIDNARAALAACPVAAIRVETPAQRHHNHKPPLTEQNIQLAKQLGLNPKFNGGNPPPFPRRLVDHLDVYFVGHHNEDSFGATPYLLYSPQIDGWIMIDTPKFSKSAVEAVETLTGTPGVGPKYLILTHVDDTAGHNDWKDHYGDSLQRIFHAGDLGRHNWIGDKTLEHVEVLLSPSSSKADGDSTNNHRLLAYDLSGRLLDDKEAEQHDVVILHTPGHSPGSISILFRPLGASNSNSAGVLFTGDTYAYRQSTGIMTGFPRYGNNRQQQGETLRKLLPGGNVEKNGNPPSWFDWSIVAPGHGHYRDYSHITTPTDRYRIQREEMEAALEELSSYGILLKRR